jgi:hypothetical protein
MSKMRIVCFNNLDAFLVPEMNLIYVYRKDRNADKMEKVKTAVEFHEDVD